jgi:hypothetical protein
MKHVEPGTIMTCVLPSLLNSDVFAEPCMASLVKIGILSVTDSNVLESNSISCERLLGFMSLAAKSRDKQIRHNLLSISQPWFRVIARYQGWIGFKEILPEVSICFSF